MESKIITDDQLISGELTIQQQEDLEAVLNPVVWCQATLKNPENSTQFLEFRDYQSEVIEYQPYFIRNEKKEVIMQNRIKVLRMGRRIGKCLESQTRIVQEDGSIKTVKDLFDKQSGSCISIDEQFKFSGTDNITIFENGVKDIYKLKTKSGREIDVTENHPFLTLDGWKDLRDLKKGDHIIVPSKIDIDTKKEIDERLVKLLGYLLGDGGLTQRTIKFTNNDENIQNDFELSCSYFPELKVKGIPKSKSCDFKIVGDKRGLENPLKQWLEELGLQGKSSHTKFIPDIIFTLKKEQIIIFLSRLFACDGWASSSNTNQRGNYQIGYASVSKDLIYGVQHLLLRFGIKSFIRYKKSKLNGKLFPSYILEIRTKDDILSFIDQISIFSKEIQCDKLRSEMLKRKDIGNGYLNLIPKEVCKKFKIGDKNCGIRTKYNVSKKKLIKWAVKFNNKYLIDLCNSDTFFDEIKDISFLKTEMTYDLTVLPYHNFIANDIIVHNTIIIAAEALHKLGTNSNFRIIYIAPFEAQCNIFFGILEKMMNGTVLQPTSFRKKPYFMQLPNGSTITGYTANVRSSRKGSSIRGAEGDHIIIDEMDHGIDEVINEVIMPIFMGNNITTITAASTPTGRRGLFWLWCQQASELGIREFYAPSQKSPKWNSESEKLARATMTKEQYTHEILAEFGEALEGVFRHTDLDVAIKNYEYNTLKYNKENLYIMGVDWNERFGVCITIIEKSRKTGLYRVFRHKIIEKQELTQLTGINAIINMHNNDCPCNFIYVDHGYGATQIELMKKYGMEHKETKLHEIVKDIDYGGNIQIKDPVSNELLDKPAKPFLVTNTQLIVEAHQLFISENEDTDQGIIGQMRQFRVSRFSASGNPVYDGGNNDHSLNALMLALCGFTLEYENTQTRTHVINIGGVINFMVPKVEARGVAVVDDNIQKFRSMLARNTPNFKTRESKTRISTIAKSVGFVVAKPQQRQMNISRSSLPKRSNF